MARRFKPVYGLFLVLVVVAAVLAADYALDRGFGHAGFERVTPGPDGLVRIAVGDLGANEVRFFRFLNAGNQEVLFFVGRDHGGTLQVAFDASETDYKRKRGFRADGEWMVNNKCDTAVRLAEVNAGQGGCRPVPLAHRLEGQELVLREDDVLQGWRFFR